MHFEDTLWACINQAARTAAALVNPDPVTGEIDKIILEVSEDYFSECMPTVSEVPFGTEDLAKIIYHLSDNIKTEVAFVRENMPTLIEKHTFRKEWAEMLFMREIDNILFEQL